MALLTKGQLEVLALVAQGNSYYEIAEIEHISWHTVKNRISLAKEKTQTSTTVQCIMLCIANGLLTIDGRGSVTVKEKGAE